MFGHASIHGAQFVERILGEGRVGKVCPVGSSIRSGIRRKVRQWLHHRLIGCTHYSIEYYRATYGLRVWILSLVGTIVLEAGVTNCDLIEHGDARVHGEPTRLAELRFGVGAGGDANRVAIGAGTRAIGIEVTEAGIVERAPSGAVNGAGGRTCSCRLLGWIVELQLD